MRNIKEIIVIIIFVDIFFVKSSFTQNWEWQNPTPTGNPINCSDFVDSLTGWFGSSAGTILHTSDGGNTWEIQYIDIPDIWIFSIDFINHFEGWAVGHPSGGYSCFLHTLDGGQTWQLEHIEENSDGPFGTLHFLNQKFGWAGSLGGDILYTHDAGQSWHFGYEGSYQIYSICFLDSLHGWAAERSKPFIYSVDGGKTWAPDTTGIIARKVFFLDSLNGWFAAGAGGIYKTTDGGKTWLNTNSPLDKFISDIYFWDKQIGWLTTDSIYRTNDGGLTWEEINDYDPVSSFDNFFNFFSPSYGWMGNFQTYDGGITLIDLRNGYTTDDFKDVQFVNENVGWLVGYNANINNPKGIIWKTIDGGINWTNQESGTTRYLFGISALDENRAWVVGSGGVILSTKNGGDNWESQYVNQGLRAVTFTDSLNGWVIGGHIFHTDDGGKTWNDQTPGQISNLYNGTFKDKNTGWIITGGGNVGAIYHTNDGGNSWFLQYENLTQSLRSVFFLNEKFGWAVGSQLILRTIDGGENWIQSEDESKYLYDVSFCDEKKGWACGITGSIFYTQDGGVTWNTNYSGTTNLLSSIDLVDENNSWIVGSNGTILHASIGCVTTVTDHFTIDQSPMNIQLFQNQPNPFNQNTVITYELSTECFVKLKIYNILGKEVKTLVNKKQIKGTYKILWDGKTEQGIDVVSGVYFYNIQINNLLNEKGKMLLIR